jgi:hypothetical protein
MTFDLDELESKAKAATPGEWQHEDGRNVGLYIDGRFEYSLVAYCGGPDRENMHEGPANAAYIASANPATILALVALIRRLQAENDDLMEQLVIRSESGMAKDMQEIMKDSNALRDENARLKQLVDFADALKAAERAYKADLENNQLSRALLAIYFRRNE